MQSISTASASLARVQINCGFARLALDVAAPDELAVTPLDVLLHLRNKNDLNKQKVKNTFSIKHN